MQGIIDLPLHPGSARRRNTWHIASEQAYRRQPHDPALRTGDPCSQHTLMVVRFGSDASAISSIYTAQTSAALIGYRLPSNRWCAEPPR